MFLMFVNMSNGGYSVLRAADNRHFFVVSVFSFMLESSPLCVQCATHSRR